MNGLLLYLTRSEWMTGKTLGNTIEASARYSYRIRTSDSLVVYLTSVAMTVSTSTCVTCEFEKVEILLFRKRKVFDSE